VRAACGRLAGRWPTFSFARRTWLARPPLKLTVAILQLAVSPGRLLPVAAVAILQLIVPPARRLAVALELLEQPGVHSFEPPEPLLERGRLGWIWKGFR